MYQNLHYQVRKWQQETSTPTVQFLRIKQITWSADPDVCFLIIWISTSSTVSLIIFIQYIFNYLRYIYWTKFALRKQVVTSNLFKGRKKLLFQLEQVCLTSASLSCSFNDLDCSQLAWSLARQEVRMTRWHLFWALHFEGRWGDMHFYMAKWYHAWILKSNSSYHYIGPNYVCTCLYTYLDIRFVNKSIAFVWIKGKLALNRTDSTTTAFLCKWDKIRSLIKPLGANLSKTINTGFRNIN